MTGSEAGREEVGRLMKALLAWFRSHPKAADTLEGIDQGWLPQGEPRTREALAQALERLVAQGRVEKHVSPEGRRLYRWRR